MVDRPGKVANPACGQLNRENCCCVAFHKLLYDDDFVK